MTGKRVVRRLAAILAADVVGYSRLMGHDESGTLAALKALRKEAVSSTASHGLPAAAFDLPQPNIVSTA